MIRTVLLVACVLVSTGCVWTKKYRFIEPREKSLEILVSERRFFDDGKVRIEFTDRRRWFGGTSVVYPEIRGDWILGFTTAVWSSDLKLTGVLACSSIGGRILVGFDNNRGAEVPSGEVRDLVKRALLRRYEKLADGDREFLEDPMRWICYKAETIVWPPDSEEMRSWLDR
jgi:hypothetical protein